jgi:hypothetical protein
MSRKRHRSTKRPSDPRTPSPSRSESKQKQWPFRACDFESYDDDHPRAAELAAAELERLCVNAAGTDRLSPNLPVLLASARAAARRELEKRGETIPPPLVEQAHERAVVTNAVAGWCAQYNAVKAGARREFEARGLKVPDYLQDREPCDSLEAELARMVADTESVRCLIADINTETAELRSQAARLQEEFERSPAGEEVSQLRAERRQMISQILQLDADITRENRNAKLLLSFCDHNNLGRPPNLPPDGKVSRFSSDMGFLVASCADAGFELPADATTIESVSRFVISQCPPLAPVSSTADTARRCRQ